MKKSIYLLEEKYQYLLSIIIQIGKTGKKITSDKCKTPIANILISTIRNTVIMFYLFKYLLKNNICVFSPFTTMNTKTQKTGMTQ